MLLVVDIGNTNITLGLYKDDKLINTYRLNTRFQRTSDEYGSYLLSFLSATEYTKDDIHYAIISSVVPKINYSFSSAIIKYLDVTPVFIGPGIKTGINIRTDNPSSLGADRIVDAVGAYYVYGGPCIVIDFGTATTFDLVDKDGTFLGGVTSAGIGITANALSSMAAQLPEIEINKPDKIIGKNTIHSMQSGVVYGYIGQVNYIIDKIKEEFGQDMKVISTGGLGRVLYNETDKINIYDPNLTFTGLKIIFDKNKKAFKKD